jgi:hypothetical protein
MPRRAGTTPDFSTINVATVWRTRRGQSRIGSTCTARCMKRTMA